MPSSSTSTAFTVGENWRDIQDPVERRKVRNRLAKRAHRSRLKAQREKSTPDSTCPSTRLSPSHDADHSRWLQTPDEIYSTSDHMSSGTYLDLYMSRNALSTSPMQQPAPFVRSSFPLATPSVITSPTPTTLGLAPRITNSDFMSAQSPSLATLQSSFQQLNPHSMAHSSNTEKIRQARAASITSSMQQSMTENRSGRTALHLVAKHGQLDMVKMLLAHGIAVNAIDDLGYTALHLASTAGNDRVVHELLQAGADVNARTMPIKGIQPSL